MDYNASSQNRLLGFEGSGSDGSDNNATTSAALVNISGSTGWGSRRNGSQLSIVPLNNFKNQTRTWHRVCTKWDGVNNTLYVDGIAQTAAASTGTLAATGRLRLGEFIAGGLNWTGNVGEIVLVKRAPTDAERAIMDAWFLRHWTRVLVTAGDSIPWNSSVAVNSYPFQYLPNANPKAWLENFCIAGTSFDAGGTDPYASRVAEIHGRIPTNKYGKTYILYINYSNNLGSYNANANNDPTGYTNALGAAAVAAKAAGYDKVLTGTVLSRADAQNNDPNRASINSILTGTGWAAAHGFDGIVDLASDSIMGVDNAPTLNASYFLDTVHPNAAGHARLEPIFTTAINAL